MVPMGNRTVLDIDIFDYNVLGDLATCVLTSLPPKCVFFSGRSEADHCWKHACCGGTLNWGVWWVVDWFPQEKGCIFSGKNLVKFRWHLKIGAWKMDLWCFPVGKNTSKVSCYFRECKSCLSFNPIPFFSSAKDGPEDPWCDLSYQLM